MRPLAVLAALTAAFAVRADWPRHPKYGFPVYTNQPAGRQMEGQWAPAGSQALSPEAEARSFRLPQGFEARLFAAEPDIANPVAMTWDERGRLWVLELYEYPLGAKPGQPGRDRVKILEDTDGDGIADKVTVFADGFNLATGLLVGNGGVYVGEAPHLWFLEDTDGDGKADKKTEVLSGFGLEDRHELLNGFAWGPDGRIYLTHGVFTRSEVVNPAAPAAPVLLTAGVARFDPATRAFEVFAEGTSNPWGVDFDAKGNAFVSACVIDHLFHLAPGGIYDRQAGQPPYPYAYESLPSIVDHRHHMAAYAGVCVYQGDQWPAEWRGEALMGNIHQNAINHDHLEPRGSSFNASRRDDFITTSDGWFMPVSTQVGPDGAVWIMDWYDKYPCYQNAGADPEGVDREKGRIWRVVWTGDQPGRPVPSHPAGMDLGRMSSSELVGQLAHPNIWRRRTAQRLLSSRSDAAAHKQALIDAAFAPGGGLETRLAAFWTLESAGLMDEPVLNQAAADKDPALRMWAARFTGDRPLTATEAGERLERLARDPDPTVRSATASACRQHLGGRLTIDAPSREGEDPKAAWRALVGLIEASKAGDDRTTDFLIWTAAEPAVAGRPDHALGWLRDHGSENLPLSATLARKTVRRLCELAAPAAVDQVVQFLGALPEDGVALINATLDGLIEANRGGALRPAGPTDTVFARLISNPDSGVVQRATELGAAWGDPTASKSLLARVSDSGAPDNSRLAAIRAGRAAHLQGLPALCLDLAAQARSEPLQIEAIRAAADGDSDAVSARFLKLWGGLAPAPRRAAAEALASRKPWALALLDAIRGGGVRPGDLSPTVLRNLAENADQAVRVAARDALGRYRAGSEDKLRLIAEKRRVVVKGSVNLDAGREVARRACLVCHKFFGEGAAVGPDLTGVGRGSLDTLLHNVINPNEIIGKGYENVEIATKDGRSFSGRMTENTGLLVRLLMAGPHEEVINKAEIESLRVSENSVMPEGLEQMPDEDFRNLIWYILSPPQEGRPLTPERRRELGGDRAAVELPKAAPTDGESVALWAPGWMVASSDRLGLPVKAPEFGGRPNVLMTHPFDSATPAAISRAIVPPLGQPSRLRFGVASGPGAAGWELRVAIEGEVVYRTEVRPANPPWQWVEVDLTPFAGRRIVVRLENATLGALSSQGYWTAPELTPAVVAGP